MTIHKRNKTCNIYHTKTQEYRSPVQLYTSTTYTDERGPSLLSVCTVERRFKQENSATYI